MIFELDHQNYMFKFLLFSYVDHCWRLWCLYSLRDQWHKEKARKTRFVLFFLFLSLSPLSLSSPSLLSIQVLNLSADVLRHVPDPIDYEATANLVADDMNPLNVVLLQEVCPNSAPADSAGCSIE